MAKKSMVARDAKRKILVERHWEKRQDLKKKIIDPSLSEEERYEARIDLNKMPRDTAPCRMRNRCSMTGRPRGFLKKFGLSRITFRELASRGMIPGVVKASW